MPTHLTPQTRLDWLRLIRSENVGPVTFHRLLQRYGSAAAALDALPELARRGGRRSFRVCTRGDAERELARLAALGARLAAWGEPEYPPLLTTLDDAPPLVAILGDASLASRPAVAIVGARNASAAGMRLAGEIALGLGARGLVVASGLARGIDSAAHKAALETGTLAVIAGGIDVVYPEENRWLHEAIAARGLLIAESAVGTEPQARHFPRRNRLISGLARGVVVVEAALRSGSLITARYAAEQGRDVFAVPGSPLDPRCRGTNDLIRNGAVLVETAADIVAGLRPDRSFGPKSGEPRRPRFLPAPGAQGISGENPAEAARPDDRADDGARSRLLELLGPTPVTVDELLRQCHLSAPEAITILLELELAGRLERHPGNQVSVRP